MTERELVEAIQEATQAIEDLRSNVCQLSVDLNLIWAAYTQKHPAPSKKVTKTVATKAKKKRTR